MKEYDITIAETLKKTVTVEAGSPEEAQEIVEDRWRDGEYVLDAESFSDVDYFVEAERDVQNIEAEKINVLLVKPGRFPQEVQIGTELEDLQKAVGGKIQVTYPFEELVGIICNEEAKNNGMSPNRAMRDEDGEVYDIIAGDFLVVGLTEDDFCSLTPEQVKLFEEKFHRPETFLKMGQKTLILPIPDENVWRGDFSEEREPKQKKSQDKALQEEVPMQEDVKKVPFKSDFGDEMVSLRVASYYYGSGLYIGLTSYSEDGPEPFADMTVNLKGYSLRPNEAFINGDGSDKFLQFIKENKLGIVCPYKYSSGYGCYTKVFFDLDRLQEFDPIGVAEFKEKHHIPEKKEILKKSKSRESER